MELLKKIWHRCGELVFNMVITHIPSHFIRLTVLRALGATIGRDTWILRGTTVLWISGLTVGNDCNIGFRCMLDARGTITVGDHVVIASDTHFITATHDIESPDFVAVIKPITVEDYVWIASRATLLCGTSIGRGAVVAACSLINRDVPSMQVVGGVPAKEIGSRTSTPQFKTTWRPLFY